jgi:mRNA interferase MazF
MTVTRGDVVLVQFPFATGQGSKLRPALVVQSDRGNARMTNTVVVQITTNLRRVGESTQLLVDPASPDGQPSGLLSPSAVSCENIATIHESRITRTIGRLPGQLMQRIDDCLKATLGLS